MLLPMSEMFSYFEHDNGALLKCSLSECHSWILCTLFTFFLQEIFVIQKQAQWLATEMRKVNKMWKMTFVR